MMESLTDSMEMAEDVTNNSDGYADSLQEKYEESFNGKLQKLESTAQGFWIKFLDQADTSGVLDFLTNLIEKLTQLTDTFGSLGTTIASIGIPVALKKLLSNDGKIGDKVSGVVG